MKHEQRLRALLEPLGVYRWEGSFQWGELRSEGTALDGAARELAHIQRESCLSTAEEEGLQGLLALLDLPAQGTPEELRQTAAALLRIGSNSFTLQAMNDTLRGCGLPARVEETDKPLHVRVTFPGLTGVPAGFSAIRQRVEAILPCHLQVEYHLDPGG